MTEDDLSADRRAVLPQLAKSALIESAAMGVVSIGRALFKHSEPSDPELQLRTYSISVWRQPSLCQQGAALETLHLAYRELRAN